MFITGWTDKYGNSISYEPMGMFVHPNGESWSNRPFTKEQKKAGFLINSKKHLD